MQPDDNISQSMTPLNPDASAVDHMRMSKEQKSILFDIPAGFSGAGMLWFTNTAPDGWLICDGSLVNVLDQPRLYRLFGTTFNTGGETAGVTFRLPDLRQRVPVGRLAGDADFGNLAQSGGSKLLASHNHSTLDATNSSLPAFDGNIVIGGGSGPGAALTQTASAFRVSNGQARTGNTGGGASGNLQPYLTINYIVKT